MPLYSRSASELKTLLDEKQISSVELVTSLLDRADQVDPGVRAYVHRFDQAALKDAETADQARSRGENLGALHGLPLSLKESLSTAGVDTTVGMKNLIGEQAREDCVTVAVAREAGAIVLGKTNVPQTQLAIETTNFIWGTTNNPHNSSKTPGGSSGGEAAALASGSSVLGIGTDIGGSVRTPANFCGVAGLKPTEYRWSNAGVGTAIRGQETIRSQVGPMARNSEDLALLFEALPSRAHALRDPFVAPVDVLPMKQVDVSKLRVGFYIDDVTMAAGKAVRRAVTEAVAHLQDAGVEVVEFRPAHVEELAYLYFAVLSSDGGATLRGRLGGEKPIQPIQQLMLNTRLPGPARSGLVRALEAAGEERMAQILDATRPGTVSDLWAYTGRRADLRIAELTRWNSLGIDALVCPAFPTAAMGHGQSRDVIFGCEYVMRYNLLNLPAGVVPVTRVKSSEVERVTNFNDRIEKKLAEVERGSKGLPVGVQVVAKPYMEHNVLALMNTIEQRARGASGFPSIPV